MDCFTLTSTWPSLKNGGGKENCWWYQMFSVAFKGQICNISYLFECLAHENWNERLELFLKCH